MSYRSEPGEQKKAKKWNKSATPLLPLELLASRKGKNNRKKENELELKSFLQAGLN